LDNLINYEFINKKHAAKKKGNINADKEEDGQTSRLHW
jgi:hypothetical protein